MSRRKTVKLNLPKVNDLIKLKFRHRVVFCEAMNRAHNWVTDWNRTDKEGNPAPKNLPSPEEAAQMCVLLQTIPEEILIEPADIALVNDIIRAKELPLEKAPPQGEEPIILSIKDWERQAERWSDSEITTAMQALLKIQARRQAKNER